MTRIKLRIAAIMLIACGALLSACGEKPPVVEEASLGVKLMDQAHDVVDQANQGVNAADSLLDSLEGK